MNWKTAYRSFYYENAPKPEDLILNPAETVMLSEDRNSFEFALRRERERLRAHVLRRPTPGCAPLACAHGEEANVGLIERGAARF